MSEEEALSAPRLKRLNAEMDAEEQAARLALAGELDPMPYEARVADAHRQRSESPDKPPPAPSPELDRHIDELAQQWKSTAAAERPDYSDFLKEAMIQAMSRMQGRDRGHER
jgi:hypothetical protein